MTFFNGFQPENIIKIITLNMGFQPFISVSRILREWHFQPFISVSLYLISHYCYNVSIALQWSRQRSYGESPFCGLLYAAGSSLRASVVSPGWQNPSAFLRACAAHKRAAFQTGDSNVASCMHCLQNPHTGRLIYNPDRYVSWSRMEQRQKYPHRIRRVRRHRTGQSDPGRW